MNTNTNTATIVTTHDSDATGHWIKSSGVESYRYFVRLTSTDVDALLLLRSRGYDCGLWDALEGTEIELSDGRCVYEIGESEIWNVAELACEDRSGFGALDWNNELGMEIDRLLSGVV